MTEINANKAILNAIKNILEGSDKLSKKDFLKAVGDAFDDCKSNLVGKKALGKSLVAKPTNAQKTGKSKGKVKLAEEDQNDEEELPLGKKVKKDNLHPEADEKPKRKLSEYQLFAKEQLALLKAREDAKEADVEKLKQKDLMKLVAKRWKLKKEGVDEEEWDDRIALMEDE